MFKPFSAIVGAGLLLAGCVATTTTTTFVSQPDAYATASVNLRAGPSRDFPRVGYVRAGAPLRVYGCVRGYSWCDVSARGDRGWMSSRYISLFYSDDRYVIRRDYDLPVVDFDFGYWDRWYTDYPFYGERVWRRRYPRYSIGVTL